MQTKRKLGQTGPEVSAVVLGSWQLSGRLIGTSYWRSLRQDDINKTGRQPSKAA